MGKTGKINKFYCMKISTLIEGGKENKKEHKWMTENLTKIVKNKIVNSIQKERIVHESKKEGVIK